MQRLPERIETERLLLRRWVAEDLRLLARAVTDNVEHLRPWMPWIGLEPMSDIDRLALVDTWTREWSAGGDVVLGVFHDGAVVGGTGLHRRVGPGGLEIGYWLDHRHVGRGFATELTRALTSVALGLDGVSRVEIHHDAANVASGRVPERLGYRRLPERPDEVTAPGEVGVDCGWLMTSVVWASSGRAVAVG